MAHGHNLPVAAEHGIQTPELRDLLAGPGVAVPRQAMTRCLVEIDCYGAVVVVHFSAVLEQAVECRLGDPTLLHACEGVLTKIVEGSGLHSRPPARVGTAPTMPRSMRG